MLPSSLITSKHYECQDKTQNILTVTMKSATAGKNTSQITKP